MITLEAPPTGATQSQFFSSEMPWPLARTPKVLLVEDDPDCNRGMSIWLRHHGYDVFSSLNGFRPETAFPCGSGRPSSR